MFSASRVMVVGDVMLDRYWHGDAERISPEAPVPIVRVTHDEVRPGGAANVALNLSSLGADADCAGLVGHDADADLLEKTLQNHNVNPLFIRVDQRTITKLRVSSQAHQMIRLDFETPFDESSAKELADSLSLEGMTAIVLSDYAKGSLEPRSLIQKARASKIPVVVDPKGTEFEKYRGATLLTPNRAEFEAVCGSWQTEQELVNKGLRLINSLDVEAILVTRSEQGMTLIARDGSVYQFASMAREVADVTGAGDTVIAAVAAGLGAGMSLAASAELANQAAGIAVSKSGTATVGGRELESALSVDHGIFHSAEDLAAWAEQRRALGEKIVMTNGCFDILHAGHVAYLREAASLGDRLVVAVNSDASVSRLKGSERPVNTVERRLQVLAGLEAIDAVIAFEDDTPFPLIDILRPDVLVKGGDYKSIEEVVGYECVLGYGGEVKVLGEVGALSTSHLIAKIRQTDSDSTN
ncbi:MAG TPA: bifunctional heptose 7-phosphate kinase/heptose 1-phosphate adenyltransferase [Gammaproteobacteria bacterium]|nr:bifunctional heptose 7-phosphate kinase/heptose 1-phosphate adenyltransferase [Gammaproteobacteria bacterium]